MYLRKALGQQPHELTYHQLGRVLLSEVRCSVIAAAVSTDAVMRAERCRGSDSSV
jgi:hypothetical protein